MYKNKRMGGIICIATGAGILIASLMPVGVIYVIAGVLLIYLGKCIFWRC